MRFIITDTVLLPAFAKLSVSRAKVLMKIWSYWACGSTLLLPYCYQPFGKLSVSRANVLMKIWGYCGM